MYSKIYRKILKNYYYDVQERRIKNHTVDLNDFSNTYLNNSLVTKRDCYHIKRSTEYLQYKSGLGSQFIALDSGYVLAKINKHTMEIGDMFGKNLSILMKEIILFCKSCGIHSLNITCSCQPEIVKSISDNFINITPTASDPLIVYTINNSIAFDAKQFLYTTCDYDTF